MDDTTKKVADMYSRYPYPSPSTEPREDKYKELSKLLLLFGRETKFELAGKRVLDAGTGTGHRLIAAAKSLPDTQFFGIDLVDSIVAVFREVAAKAGATNVEAGRANIVEGLAHLGKFDIALCMGVLHHLSDPERGLRNVADVLTEDGFAFLYLYGALGSRERMRRKQVLKTLSGDDRDDFEVGIQLAKDLGFDEFEYGWSLDSDDVVTDTQIVDAYLNVNERLYVADSIHELVSGAGFYAYATYGITIGDQGLLFNAGTKRFRLAETSIKEFLPSDAALERYESLPVRERYKLIDLFYQPNGYTVVAMTEGAIEQLSTAKAVRASLVVCGEE